MTNNIVRQRIIGNTLNSDDVVIVEPVLDTAPDVPNALESPRANSPKAFSLSKDCRACSIATDAPYARMPMCIAAINDKPVKRPINFMTIVAVIRAKTEIANAVPNVLNGANEKTSSPFIVIDAKGMKCIKKQIIRSTISVYASPDSL